MEKLIVWFQNGGIWMYPLLLVSAMALSIIIERLFYYYIHCRVNAKLLMTQTTRLIRNGELEKARQLCAKMKNPLAMILECSIWHYQQQEPDQEIQNAIDEVGLRELPKILRRTHFLSLFANMSTLVGLLGTIFGMQGSFAALATADPSQKAALLAKGISLAMNATAFGLMVAITCMVMYSILGSKANTIIEEIDESSVRMLNFLFSQRRE
jgi:biopolymer transport protein ExbB